MAIIYREAEEKDRPGVYQRFVNLDDPALQVHGSTPDPGPGPGPDPPVLIFLADEFLYVLLDEKERILMDEESDIA